MDPGRETALKINEEIQILDFFSWRKEECLCALFFTLTLPAHHFTFRWNRSSFTEILGAFLLFLWGRETTAVFATLIQWVYVILFSDLLSRDLRKKLVDGNLHHRILLLGKYFLPSVYIFLRHNGCLPGVSRKIQKQTNKQKKNLE